MAKIAGTVYVRVDGQQLKTKGSVEVPMLKVKRETIMADDGPAGHSETAAKPFIKATVIVGPDFPLDQIQDGDDLTVTAELANGMTYVLTGAYVVDDPVLKSEGAEAEITFEAMSGGYQ